ncbi:FecR domain-containing protein [Haloferula sp.]|uniref:FecR domain-containing protein n=1 Tax=Haloferula sp. TaxID=2497595 RepID=UPI00329BD995
MNTYNKSELVLKFFDGEISDEDFQTLQELLQCDAEMRRIYQDHVAMEHLLQKGDAFVLPSLSKLERRPTGRRKSLWVAAACLLALLTASLFFKTASPPPTAEMRFATNTSFSLSGSDDKRVLQIGDELQIAYGAVELKLPREVAAIVVGPAKLRIQDEQTLILDEGKASFTVPEQGHGFRVFTPTMKVVDLGTKFVVISKWSDVDEVHVVRGQVNVTSGGGKERLLSEGEAVSVGEDGSMAKLEQVGAHFHPELPEQTTMLVEDDFESLIADGKITYGLSPEWKAVGGSELNWGSFNPQGRGTWYRLRELADDGPTFGLVEGMKGPRLGFIFARTRGRIAVERAIARIESGHVYNVGLTLGVRSTLRCEFGGYEIALVSGSEVLASKSSVMPPTDPGGFSRINFSWDSNGMPPEVKSGDQLEIRITCLGKGEEGKDIYLDFDHLQVSKMAYSSD